MSDSVTVRATHHFPASPEVVFDAWLDPVTISDWMVAPAPGDIVRITRDPRPGGAFSFVVRRGGFELDHAGRYLELERPKRIAFEWGIAAMAMAPSVVRIDLAPADGGTALALEHAGVPANFAARTAEGWASILDAIEVATT